MYLLYTRDQQKYSIRNRDRLPSEVRIVTRSMEREMEGHWQYTVPRDGFEHYSDIVPPTPCSQHWTTRRVIWLSVTVNLGSLLTSSDVSWRTVLLRGSSKSFGNRVSLVLEGRNGRTTGQFWVTWRSKQIYRQYRSKWNEDNDGLNDLYSIILFFWEYTGRVE